MKFFFFFIILAVFVNADDFTAMMPSVHHVQVADPIFLPQSLTINVHDTVIFNFSSNGHTVTESSSPNTCISKPGGFDSGVLSNGVTFSHTFYRPGNYSYFCSVGDHCVNGMKGVIGVAAATSDATKDMSYSLASTVVFLSLLLSMFLNRSK
jgi:plastocyanin